MSPFVTAQVDPLAGTRDSRQEGLDVTLRRPLAGFPGYEELKGRGVEFTAQVQRADTAAVDAMTEAVERLEQPVAVDRVVPTGVVLAWRVAEEHLDEGGKRTFERIWLPLLKSKLGLS